MNGKVERYFKTFKLWQRVSLFHLSFRSIQKRLDVYRDWYNTQRPQWDLGCRTPNEVWKGIGRPKATPICERDTVKPAMTITKEIYKGDAHLAVLNIEVVREASRAA